MKYRLVPGEFDLSHFDPSELRGKDGRWTKDAVLEAMKYVEKKLQTQAEADGGPDRLHMPQLSGVPNPGSKADLMFPDRVPGTEVDLTPEFAKWLGAKGVKIKDAEVLPSDLKPSQDQLVAAKVVGLAKFMRKAPADSPVFEPVFTTMDNHVIDGHHRWAAREVVNEVQHQQSRMKVRAVQADRDTALRLATEFMDEYGLPREGLTNKTTVSTFATLHPHEIVASDLKVGDRLHRNGKTKVSQIHPNRSTRVVAKVTTKGSRSPSILRANPGEKITVYRGYPEINLAKVSLKTDIDLAFNPAELRNAKGEWAKSAAFLKKAAPAKNPVDALLDADYEAKTKVEKTRKARIKKTMKGSGRDANGNPTKIVLNNRGVTMDTAVKMVSDSYDWEGRDQSAHVSKGIESDSVDQQDRAQIVGMNWFSADVTPDSPPEEQYAASLWEQYQNPDLYIPINKTLRTGKMVKVKGAPGPEPEAMKRYVDIMFDKGGWTTEKPTVLYHAIKSDGRTDWSKKFTEGAEFHDDGIMSTTAMEHFGEGWLMGDKHGEDKRNEKPSDVVIEIHVPAGTRVVGGNPGFVETMLHPGTRMRIKSVKRQKANAVNPLNSLLEFRATDFEYTRVVAEVIPDGQ